MKMKNIYTVIDSDKNLLAVFSSEWEAYYYVERGGTKNDKINLNKSKLHVKAMTLNPDWS